MSSVFKYSLLFFLCVLCAGCKKEKKPVKDPTTVTDTLKIDLEAGVKKETSFNAGVEKKAKQMPGFPVLESGIASLKGETIGSVKAQVEDWVNATKELRLALLDSVSNRAINARMTLLVTKASILKQEVEKRNIDTLIINREATEFYSAFQDLAMQLNLEYGSSVADFLKDFKAESQKLRENARKQKALEKDTINDQ